MPITYPLALPTITHFQRINFAGHATVAVSRSVLTLVSQIQEHQGQLWTVEVSLVPMKREAAEQWLAFLLSLNGRLGTFLMFDPAAPNPRGSLDGTPLVDGAVQTGQVLNTKGWTPSAVDVLLAGDYLSLGTGVTTRLYKVLNNVTADGSGLAAIDIWPRLREATVDGAAITFTRAEGTFRLMSNTSGWDVSTAQFYGLGFSAEEAI